MNSAILGSYRMGNKMKDFKPLVFAVYIDAKQKHPGCKKVQGQSEAALQTGATKNFDIS